MPDICFYALICVRDDDATDFAPLSLARELADRHGGKAHAVLAGANIDDATARAREAGVDHVWIIPCGEAPQPHQLADLYAQALRSPGLAEGLERALLLVATRQDNEELAGRLAALLDAVALGRCTGFDIGADGALQARRKACGNRLDITQTVASGAAIASVRAAGSTASAGGQAAMHVLEGLAAPGAPYPITALPRNEQHAGLNGARLVVSGGRGMGKEDAFPLLYQLAEKLGGAVGASLPAVDAGWAPVNRQVGISGNYVSPDIYLAIGISGTPQHMAGIDPHTRIAAVNRDPQADIFNAAQIGVVAEWQELVPALIQALEGSDA